MGSYNFKVDLKGIIRLSSDNLYSSDKVFLRELLQNSVDAVDARKKAEPEFKDGRINVYYRKKADGAQIIFEDNGIGLNKEEIHTFLSVIGQSSKRDTEVRNSFIGQFGIGLLSCFLASNEIKVLTRAASEEKGYQWIGKSDGSYAITALRKEIPVGTQVHLELTGRKYEVFTEREIIDDLAEYGYMLLTPVYFKGEEQEKILNQNFIPWRQPFSVSDDILGFGEQLLGETFFDVVPLSGEGMKGYAFISARQSSANSAARHKIYLKNMFITEDGQNVVPKWAFFIRCVLNVEDLTPTASRESFIKDQKLLHVKSQIEKSIFDYFVTLSQYDVRKLKQLTSIHNLAIKSLVVENEQIFKLFFPFLTFPTSQGVMTGFQIVSASQKIPVNYTVDVDEFRRICPLLEGTNSLLVNGGYVYDASILQRLPRYYKNVRVKAFDENSYENLLEEPPGELRDKMAYFIECAMDALRPFQCKVSLKSFSPNPL
ncbi:MAG: HSP90 family protein, partial [Lachnospiraceae bacterium]|nr:HSP90 family protein [Lachnospiraceae bacterium]